MAAGAGLQGSRTLYGFSGSASHVHQVSSPAHQVILPAAVYTTDHNIPYDDRASRTTYKRHTAGWQDLLLVHHPSRKLQRIHFWLNTFLK